MIHSIIIFGATGSIGTHALNVIRRNRDKFSIAGASANSNFQKLAEMAQEFNIKKIGIGDKNKFFLENARQFFPKNTIFFHGTEGHCELASSDDADSILMAIPGIAGILPTLFAIRKKKTIMLASKEVLVAAGKVIMDEAKFNGINILPIDSEHNAIFQCLQNERKFLKKIILTASGGPFRNYTNQRMLTITPEQALRHPTWSMGKKITIDSSTMANKGLEMIEAKWLFGLSANAMSVVIHPESIVHSMAEFCDGSILAQLAPPNMEHPISNCLFYPNRENNPNQSIDFTKTFSLNFSEPSYEKFPCLQLAKNCLDENNRSSAIFLSADEVAVEAFLNKRIRYIDIPKIIGETLDSYSEKCDDGIDGIFYTIERAKALAENITKRIAK